jgi:hypothetical protein
LQKGKGEFEYQENLKGKDSGDWHAVVQLVEALRYNPEVVGSIADGVIGIFYLHNPSGRTVALGSTQPLTEMSSPVRTADSLTTFICRLPRYSGSLNLLEPSRPVQACTRIVLLCLCRPYTNDVKNLNF